MRGSPQGILFPEDQRTKKVQVEEERERNEKQENGGVGKLVRDLSTFFSARQWKNKRIPLLPKRRAEKSWGLVFFPLKSAPCFLDPLLAAPDSLQSSTSLDGLCKKVGKKRVSRIFAKSISKSETISSLFFGGQASQNGKKSLFPGTFKQILEVLKIFLSRVKLQAIGNTVNVEVYLSKLCNE